MKIDQLTPGVWPDTCVEFDGGKDSHGYGWVKYLGKYYATHRLSFFLHNGYWPTVCRHKCDNPPCINPYHLLDGTVTDNNRDCVERGRNGQSNKTHCPRGHEYTEDNTWVHHGSRECRTCNRRRSREYRRKRR